MPLYWVSVAMCPRLLPYATSPSNPEGSEKRSTKLRRSARPLTKEILHTSCPIKIGFGICPVVCVPGIIVFPFSVKNLSITLPIQRVFPPFYSTGILVCIEGIFLVLKIQLESDSKHSFFLHLPLDGWRIRKRSAYVTCEERSNMAPSLLKCQSWLTAFMAASTRS